MGQCDTIQRLRQQVGRLQLQLSSAETELSVVAAATGRPAPALMALGRAAASGGCMTPRSAAPAARPWAPPGSPAALGLAALGSSMVTPRAGDGIMFTPRGGPAADASHFTPRAAAGMRAMSALSPLAGARPQQLAAGEGSGGSSGLQQQQQQQQQQVSAAPSS